MTINIWHPRVIIDHLCLDPLKPEKWQGLEKRARTSVQVKLQSHSLTIYCSPSFVEDLHTFVKMLMVVIYSAFAILSYRAKRFHESGIEAEWHIPISCIYLVVIWTWWLDKGNNRTIYQKRGERAGKDVIKTSDRNHL